MKVLIGHSSALEYLRTDAAALRNPKLLRTFPKPPSDASVDARVVAALNLEALGIRQAPVHVFAPEKNLHRRSSYIACHTRQAFAPRTQFVLAQSGVYVSSAPACFLDSAPARTIPELILLGCELCGTYRLAPNTQDGFVQRLPLCSAANLRLHLESARAAGSHGSRKATEAARFVLDGSASPAETALVLLLTLPPRLGGYGLPLPILNHPVSTRPGTRLNESKTFRVCDAYWPKHRIDLEYDSDAEHTGGERIARDADRRNELARKNITVVTVTKQQLYHAGKLHEVACVLASLMGRRLRIRASGFSEKRRALRMQLLGQQR